MASNEPQWAYTCHAGKDFDLYRTAMATKAPEISVIFSRHHHSRGKEDCESSLKRAIDSILKQSFTNFELILIDACSSDDTKEYFKEIVARDPRVQFYHVKDAARIPAERNNFGIAVSRGKYVAFMFDDHQWELNALEDLYQGIEKHYKNYGMVYGLSTQYYGSDAKDNKNVGGKWGWNAIHSTSFISPSSVIVRRGVIDLVGGYDEDPAAFQECFWDLCWRIGRKFRVGRVKRKIGNVYCELTESVDNAAWDEIRKKREENHLVLPLQVIQDEPLSCQVRSTCFDRYVKLSQRVRKVYESWDIKQRLIKLFPVHFYQVLKKILSNSTNIFTSKSQTGCGKEIL